MCASQGWLCKSLSTTLQLQFVIGGHRPIYGYIRVWDVIPGYCREHPVTPSG